MIYLVEEFFSLQGEGKYIGTPSYFLRFGGCNLKCSGFGCEYEAGEEKRLSCDTYFAVDNYFKNSWQKIETSTEIIKRLKAQFVNIGYNPDVVITGGEPLIYHNSPIFYEIVEFLNSLNINITFETNGTIDIDFNRYPAYKEAIFSLSIKLSNSNEPKSKRLNSQAIKSIINNSKEAFFKFTIDKNLIETSAKKEILEITKDYNQDIFCMPVGETREVMHRNSKAVFEFCKENNFRYSDRLHIRFFDDAKGV